MWCRTVAMEPIVSPEIHDKITQLSNNRPISNDGKNIVAPLIEIFQDFLSSLDMKFKAFKDEMMKEARQKNEDIGRLMDEVAVKNKTIAKLEERIDAQDQYSRRESLVFSGDSLPVHKPGEDCAVEICKLVQNKLGDATAVMPSDISIAHRLGPKPTVGTDKRNIIARFCRRSLKYKILNKARSSKPSNFYVNESLTPTRQTITRVIRKAKSEFPSIVSGYNTVDGSIYVWVKPPNADAPGARNSRLMVNSMEKLEQFCQKSFQRPVSHFLPPNRAERRASGSNRADDY